MARRGKILAFDYGLKRTGLAITDELKMIASPLTTVETKELFPFLEKLMQQENIECFVVGDALRLDGSASETTLRIDDFAQSLSKKFPDIKLERVNEMFTSKLAAEALVTGGMKKKDRQKKGNLDKVAAALILRSYLESIST